MSNAPTIETIAEDLSLAMEVSGEFGYRLADDGKTITAEAYADDGEISTTYTLTIDIKENEQ